MSTCHACGRESRNAARWTPVIVKGNVVGATCQHCPKHGEPIRRTTTKDGAVRYRVTLDKGVDGQGRRKQETKVLLTLEAARDHVNSRGEELRKARKSHKVVADRITVSELIAEFLEAVAGTVRDNTLEGYRFNLKPVERRLGDRAVASLTKRDITTLRGWLLKEGGRYGKPLGQHAARGAMARFKQALDHAVPEYIDKNPATGVKAPKVMSNDSTTILERWTAPQVLAFIAHADRDRLAAAWRLSALGLRREEVLGLRWSDIDTDAGTIAINQTRVAVSKATDERGWMTGDPKSKQSARSIKPDSVMPGTMKLLKELKVASVVDRHANPSGLCVVDEAGRPMVPKAYTDRFQRIADAAGVPVIKLHSTRHTLAYLFHEAKVPPVRAAAFLGHRLDVHLGVYLFAREDDVDLASVALGAALAGAAVGA